MIFIERRRLELGLTRSQLAAACGANKTTIQCWETGVRRVSNRMLPLLAKALQVDELEIVHTVGVQTGHLDTQSSSFLSHARAAAGANQPIIAKYVGVKPWMISCYESGRTRVPEERVRRYAKVLGVSEKEFRGNVKIRNAKPVGTLVSPDTPANVPTRVRSTVMQVTSKTKGTQDHSSFYYYAASTIPAGRCAEPCKCLRWQCTLCRQYWTGKPIHECGKPHGEAGEPN